MSRNACSDQRKNSEFAVMETIPIRKLRIRAKFDSANDATLFHGDCKKLLRSLARKRVQAQLVLTSPPYNIGKSYERISKLDAAQYFEEQASVISMCASILAPGGSLCWQVGNQVDGGAIQPLDILLYPIFIELGFVLRNRIVWHFEHGLNPKRRLSGRYETVLWFTRKDEDYFFNLDEIRVRQKYPGKKAYQGIRKGEFLSNPLGKNPGDVWIFPNVKQNHVEKTSHPCQFPVELVERLVKSLTRESDLVVDPYMGVGSTGIGATLFGRRFAGAETASEYVSIANTRFRMLKRDQLKVRKMNTPVFQPRGKLTIAPWDLGAIPAPSLSGSIT